MSRLYLLALLVCSNAIAQFDASVLGTVKDPTGLSVAGSKVTLSNLANGVQQSASTDNNGNYQFPNVRIGDYTVKAEKQGFKAATASRFTVTVNAKQRVDLALEVGSTSETVMVTGAAEILETDTSDRGEVIGSHETTNLPLNGRSYADLTLLVPGVRKSLLQDVTSLASRDASYNVNGQRSESNNFLLDGVDNNAYGTSNQGFSNQIVQINPDAVAEFRVVTNNFSAEYGRASGAVIIATTKSGTNKLHGSLWEYLRNTELNAVGFFKPLGNVKPTFNQNQFGISAGGPIIKDKLFIFADFESLRRSQSQLAYATLPTLDQRKGNLGTAVMNPLTGEVYSSGIIPASAILPSTQAILNALPLPNSVTVNNANNFQSLPKGTVNDNKGDFRIDYYANSKLTMFTRYSHRVDDIFVPGNIPGPAGGNNNGNVHIFNQQLDPGVSYMFNSKTVLDARLAFSWVEGGKSPLGLGEPSLLIGIPGLPTDKLVAGALNQTNVQGFDQFGRQGSNPQFQNPFSINPKVNLTHIMNRHTLKVGYEYLNLTTAIDDFNPSYGNFQYNGSFSKVAGSALNTTLQNQAWGLADFMFGAPSHYELNNLAVVDYKQFMHFAYFQDDFKVNDRLTLNLGLRYEFASPQWVADNRLANFDPATKSLIQAKSGSLYERSLQDPKYNNFAPRVGVAYRPFGRKTVIRSAYGLSYQQFNRLGGENLLAYNGPNIVDAAIDQIPSQGICKTPSAPPQSCFRPTSFGYPDGFASPANFDPLRAQARYIPRDNPTGYVESWHVSVQHELAKDLLLDVAYVGNRGVHLMILADYNQAAPNTASTNLSLQARRPVQNFSAIEVAFGAGNSKYNALQMKLEKRFGNGLFFLNSFSYSDTKDNAAGHLETAGGDNSRVNYANIRGEWGTSNYNQPINNTASIVYELPFGKGRRFGASAHPVMQAIAGGWQFTTINTMASGLPINLTYSPTPQFQVSGLPNYRPNQTCDPVTPEGQRTVSTYLNKACVSLPTDPSQPWGNAIRNSAKGYPLIQVDMGMHKAFTLWNETSRLQFRAEAFNIINQTNFQQPNSNASSSAFGTITSTYPARQIQFAVKLLF